MFVFVVNYAKLLWSKVTGLVSGWATRYRYSKNMYNRQSGDSVKSLWDYMVLVILNNYRAMLFS